MERNVVEPTGQHQITLIFLHGWAETGDVWPKRLKLLIEHFPNCRFIFPTSPLKLETPSMITWFKLTDPSRYAPDLGSVQEAKNRIYRLIDEEVKKGTLRDRIFLGGFSQGAALSLYAGLGSVQPLGGIISLSPGLPTDIEQIERVLNPFNEKTPIFFATIEQDKVIKERWGAQVLKRLQQTSVPISFRRYPGEEHRVIEEELGDVAQFIKTALNERVVVEPSEKHSYSLIFLHGWSETGGLWQRRLKLLIEKLPNCRFIFPTSPVKVSDEASMRTWIRIDHPASKKLPDPAEFDQAKTLVRRMIDEEVLESGISRDLIFVGGFSQGAFMALYTCLDPGTAPVAGLIALSPALPPDPAMFDQAFPRISTRTPVLLGVIQDDPMIKIQWAREAVERFKQTSLPITFSTYPGEEHKVIEDEQRDVAKFVKRIGIRSKF